MATDPSGDLGQFHQFVGQQLRGNSALSPEEVLFLYRTEHPTDDDDDEIVQMVQEALDDMKAGKPSMPAEEFFSELRREFGFRQEPQS